MALVTKADVKLRLEQLATSTEHDALLDRICTEIEDVITLYLGFSFDGYGTATTKTVYGTGTPFLTLPPHNPSSITLVTSEGSTSAITGYTEDEDGTLYFTSYSPYSSYGWYQGQRYTVTAEWGYGDPPDSIKKVAVEMACAAFRERDKAYSSDVIGVEGAGGMAIGYKGALLKQHEMILRLTKRRYLGLQIA